MNKKHFITGLFCCSVITTAFAVTPDNMQVWLKDGSQQVFNISEVDSVTFSETQQSGYKRLTENTLPPVFAKPNSLVMTVCEEYQRVWNKMLCGVTKDIQNRC